MGREQPALERFRLANVELFKKNDRLLSAHLALVLSFLFLSASAAVLIPFWPVKILFCAASAFLWFSLINITIHHHHTHHNAAAGSGMKKILNFLYRIALPNAPKRLNRYARAHLNHHARPFDETDVDHHYGTRRFLAMREKGRTGTFLYFLELTFVGAHMPGWEDDAYMNQVPMEEWRAEDYENVKHQEGIQARRMAAVYWGSFLATAFFLPWLAWGWVFPMLLVKNWAHYLGQFQHYDDRFLDPGRSALNRARTYHIPSWFNYLAGGEISGHFLHHLFPEMPYYKIETARKRFLKDPKLNELFMTY